MAFYTSLVRSTAGLMKRIISHISHKLHSARIRHDKPILASAFEASALSNSSIRARNTLLVEISTQGVYKHILPHRGLNVIFRLIKQVKHSGVLFLGFSRITRKAKFTFESGDQTEHLKV